MIETLTITIRGCNDCPYCREAIWNGTSTNVPDGMRCELKDPSLGRRDDVDDYDPLDELEDNGYPVWCPLKMAVLEERKVER